MTSLITMTLIGGLVLGWLTGRRFQRAHRAWLEYRTTKNSLPNLRTNAWGMTRPAAGFTVAAIVVTSFALYLIAQHP
ncbi:MAG TPA: hypothetical protein VHJ83_01220 [Micromonosporaceae bacterium]|nr:hypothetical protein [Micromonosporaceae bacterium]